MHLVVNTKRRICQTLAEIIKKKKQMSGVTKPVVVFRLHALFKHP